MRAKKKAPSKSRRDEIVDELVSLLVPNGDEGDKLSSYAMAVFTIQTLQQSPFLTKPLWGFSEANRKSLSAISNNIQDLRKILAGAPGEVILLLAGADPSDQIPSQREQQTSVERLKRILSGMGYLQQRCEELQAQKVGEHGLVKISQRVIADEAWRLMKNHMLAPDPASGIDGSAYGTVATLLWEAVTGEPDKDLQRACKAALTRAKAGELREWQGL